MLMAHASTDGLCVAARAAPRPPPTRSSFPWRRYCVRSTPLQGGVAVVASIASAAVGGLGLAATAMDLLFPPIPFLPDNITECQ